MKIKEFIKSHKKPLAAGAVLLCFWVLVVGILYIKIVDVTYEKDFVITSISDADEYIQLYADDTLEQKIDFSLSEITAITIEIPGEQELVEWLDILLYVYDQNHSMVQECVVEGKNLVNASELYIHFDKTLSPGTYYVEISAELSDQTEKELGEGKTPVLELCKGVVIDENYAALNGQTIDTSLAVNERNLSWSNDSYRGLCAFVTVIIAITFLLLFYLSLLF